MKVVWLSPCLIQLTDDDGMSYYACGSHDIACNEDATEHHCRPRASINASIKWLFTITANLGHVSNHLHFKAKMDLLRYSIDSTLLWYSNTSLTGRILHVLLGPRPLSLCLDTANRESGDMEKFCFFNLINHKMYNLNLKAVLVTVKLEWLIICMVVMKDKTIASLQIHICTYRN